MSEDWNQEFTELVRSWLGAPDEVAPAETDRPAASEPPPASTRRAEAATDPDQAAAARRAAIATALVRVGFIDADHATPENPAVEVLAELLPQTADINLCLTCHDISSSGAYAFARTTGEFPHRGLVSTDQAWSDGSPRALAEGNSRRVFVACTKDALCWTESHVLSVRYDRVTLYAGPFRDILGATVRRRRKGIVDVWIDNGPTLSFRVDPNAAGALQAKVDRAAQSE